MGGWTSALLVGFLQGLLQVGTAREEGAVPPELYQAEVRAIEVAAGGDLWFSVRGQGLARLRSGEISWVTVDDGLASAGVADLLEDRHGRLWAVGLGGFSVFDGDRWRARDGFADLQPRVIFDVYEEPDSDAIWLAASGGAGRLEDGVWTVLRTSDGLPHPVVHAVVVDARGAVWLACRTGLARIEAGVVEVQFPGVNFRSALQGPNGVLWFGTSDGIYAWDGSSWTHHLEGTTVYVRLVTAAGVIWAGSAGAGVFRNEEGEWEPVDLPQRLLGAEVFDLAEGPDGSIWVATSAGVGRLSPAR